MVSNDKVKKLFVAAANYVEECGPCSDACDFDDEPYCQDPDCAYCSLAVAVQEVSDEGEDDD